MYYALVILWFSDLFLPCSMSWISWSVLPSVSGNTNAVNNSANIQHRANIQNTKCMPIASHTVLNVFVNMKPRNQQKLAVKAEATDLRLVGNISPIIAHGSGPKPENYFNVYNFIQLILLDQYSGLSILCNRRQSIILSIL